MSKIRIITDSASDIPDELLGRYGIEMLHIPITVDGKGYLERKDFTIQGYYEIIAKAKEIPSTSKISHEEYAARYQAARDAGYTDVIVVTLCSYGSAIHESALLARRNFYDENPGAEAEFGIYVVDSLAFTMAYGYAVVEAAKKAEAGETALEITGYLEKWSKTIEMHFGLFTLSYIKKSGRVSGVAAFVGEALGLRPIISIIDGKTNVAAKVRGDKNVAAHLFEVYKKNRASADEPVFVIQGSERAPAEELAGMLEKEIGRSVEIYSAGAAIVTHGGPRLLAIVFHAKK